MTIAAAIPAISTLCVYVEWRSLPGDWSRRKPMPLLGLLRSPLTNSRTPRMLTPTSVKDFFLGQWALNSLIKI
ncbi:MULTISPECIES: hypothetical protein [Planktothricoides]|uniref:Secreted protein n=2 Tax=Planktothricoides raciborskii TaxID=132608 RepID=A0AAU8JM78_9CYAN|nr:MULTISPECIES: hypothetical protein [Planktothricoides]MBD2543554.1 hypothetical protein [Planktothricoides raciborskii FACHB-1370]MBD2581244.1 hypothetical protein [Planktothricoides raciborskii FACHB-1261]